jgi:hypothetical protein
MTNFFHKMMFVWPDDQPSKIRRTEDRQIDTQKQEILKLVGVVLGNPPGRSHRQMIGN